MVRVGGFPEAVIKTMTNNVDLEMVRKQQNNPAFWDELAGEAQFGWGKDLPDGAFDGFVEVVAQLADRTIAGPPKKETLRDAMERVGLEQSTIGIMCEQLDLGMVKAQLGNTQALLTTILTTTCLAGVSLTDCLWTCAGNSGFWEDIGGAEWAMTLQDGQLAMFVLNLQLVCDPTHTAEAQGVLFPSVEAMIKELPDAAASVEAEPGDRNHWPFPSFAVAELRLDPGHRRKARAQEKKKTNMCKFKVLAKMTAAQVGALDVEKRELDEKRAVKQKIIADRRQAEKDEEERIKAEAIEAMGIDALGPMPMAEPGAYHALVDATEHRIPILAAQPGTEQDGTDSGKASSYHVFAPPMRENLHMDEARKRRAHVHCDRYDFSFSDNASRRTAWHGSNATKEDFLRMGLNSLTGGYENFPSVGDKKQGANKYAAEIMAERTMQEVEIRKQMLEQTSRRLVEEGWNDTGADVAAESLQLQSEIMASMDRSKIKQPPVQKAPILWKGKGKDAAASLVETNRTYSGTCHTIHQFAAMFGSIL